MKHNIASLILCGMTAGTLALSSCNNAEYSVLTNQAYIAQTQTDGNTSVKITLGKEAVTQELNVRLSDPTDEKCTFEIAADTAAVTAFNRRNETSYKALPADQFSLSTSEISIEPGQSASQALKLTVNPLSAALKKSGEKYAVALKLASKDGRKNVLASGSTIVYILDQVVIQPVPVINSTHNIHFTMRTELALTEWTLEMCVNMSLLGKTIGAYNNQALFGGWAPKGKDGEIYTRFGDAPIEGNRLQIKTQGTQMNSKMLFEENKWYHLAFVCEGKKLSLYVNGALDSSMDLPGKVTNLAKNINFGNTDYLRANVKVSELRLWTKARTQSEIVNNMYSCTPKTPGLEAYWKMNEGKGDIINDATGHGNTGKVVSVPEWIQDVRNDGK